MTRALGSRLSALGSRLSALGSRLSALGSRLSALGSRLSALGSRLSALGSRLSALGSRLLLTVRPSAAAAVGAGPAGPPRTRLRRVPARDGILAGPATVPWAAHTSTVVHPSRGQVEGSATRLPTPAAPAGWRFAKSPPSRAGAIATSTQIACNSTKSYVKWV